MVLAKITIKHELSSGGRGMAAYHGSVCAVYSVLPEDDMQNAVETCRNNKSVLM